MKKEISSLLFFSLLWILNSCGGPSSILTPRDVNKLQREENTALRSDELIPVLGTYAGLPENHNGLYLQREDRWFKFELILTVHNVSVEDSGTIDAVVVPQLGGSAKQWIEGTDTYIQLEVESGSYNPQTQKIYLKFKDSSLSLEGVIENNQIFANWNSSLRGDIAGKIVVQK